MFFAISAHNGVPIYEQIVPPGEIRRCRRPVGLRRAGPLGPRIGARIGDQSQHGRAADRELQAEGILETVRGTGLEIAAGAGRLCADERLKLVRGRLKEVFREARQSRLDVKQLRTLVERELSALEREGNES